MSNNQRHEIKKNNNKRKSFYMLAGNWLGEFTNPSNNSLHQHVKRVRLTNETSSPCFRFRVHEAARKKPSIVTSLELPRSRQPSDWQPMSAFAYISRAEFRAGEPARWEMSGCNQRARDDPRVTSRKVDPIDLTDRERDPSRTCTDAWQVGDSACSHEWIREPSSQGDV